MIAVSALRDPSREWALDRSLLVIPGRFIVPGREKENTSRLGDAEWQLGCAITRVNTDDYTVRLRFDSINDTLDREFVREALYLSLHFDHASVTKWRFGLMTPGGLSQLASRIRLWLRDVREAGLQLHEIDQAWLNRWLETHRQLAPTTLVHRVTTLRRLYLYGSLMSFRTVEVAPWGQGHPYRPSRKGASQSPRENLTLRIPEAESEPALRWAMFYIDHGFTDILRARKDFDPALQVTGDSSELIEQRINSYINDLRRLGQGLPVDKRGQPARAAIARAAKVSWRAVNSRKKLIEEAFRELGPETSGSLQCRAELTGCNVAWRAHIRGRESFEALKDVLAACYIIVAYLSGMRDSEITSLRRGCLKTRLDEEGLPYRWEIEGLIHKGRQSGEARKHTWVVVEPVARAIHALEILQDHLARFRTVQPEPADADLLFLRPVLHPDHAPSLKGGQSSAYLRRFIGICRSFAIEAEKRAPAAGAEQVRRLYGFPLGDAGTAWHWHTRQLRRTLAWYIANQPFGVVAGMIQYGHASEMMFEGYAGTSASGFRAEIEEERRISRLSDIVEAYENWKNGGAQGGPMAVRIAAEFETVRKALGDLPGVVVDTERRARMLRNTATLLHPGFVNDCFFHPEHALCLPKEGGKRDQPALSRCVPDKCPNSFITSRHLKAIDECLADAQEMRARSGLSPLQKHVIDRQIGVYRELRTSIETKP